MSAIIQQMVLRKRAGQAQSALQAAANQAAYARAVAEARGDPGMVWRGEWDKNELYAEGDVVGRKGSSYIAERNEPSGAPPGADWGLVAKKGDDGKKGKDGRDGAIIIAEGGGGAGAPSESLAGVFINDVQAINGIVGMKVFKPGTVPADVELISCVTDTPTVRVLVSADGGADNYSPTVIVNGVTAVLTETSTKRWFTGYADIIVPDGGVDIVATNGNSEAVASIDLAGAGPMVLDVVLGSYPGVQTALKAGDQISVTVYTEPEAVDVTLTGPATPLTLPVVAGVATGTLTINGASGVQTFSVVAHNSLGTPGDAFTSAPVVLDQAPPIFSAITITYPVGHGALDVGETLAANCSITDFDFVVYSGSSLVIDQPTSYAPDKTVGHTAAGYVTPAYVITAGKSSNGSTASTSAQVKIATVPPAAAISITPSGRLSSSPGGVDYVVRISPDQPLLAAPLLTAPAGAWQGSWSPSAGNSWVRTLRISDNVARGQYAFTDLVAAGLSGLIGSNITGGASYTVGGFSQRTLTFVAFSRVTAIGTTVGDAAKLAAQISGGNVLVLQPNNDDVANGFYPADADGAYNAAGAYIGLSDVAFAGSNTSGTLQIIVSEAA